MRESRFPPLFSGPSLAAAVVALVVGVALLAVTGFTPYALVAVGHEGATLMAALFLTILLVCVLIYRLAAPRLWRFTNRFVDRSVRPTLPTDLVGPCLRQMDCKCPVCSYNWRGLDQPACPECNAPVKLFIYTDRPPTTRWNGLVISWLVVTLLASGVVVFSCVMWVRQMARYGGTGAYSGLGTLYWVAMVFVALVAAFDFVTCVILSIKALIPKSPEHRGLFVRRTVIWLAVLNGSAAVAVMLQLVSTTLTEWLY